MPSLRASIAHVLISEGEATARQLSGKLNTDGTTMAIALKEMYDAGEVDRQKVWVPHGNPEYRYTHKSASTKLTGAPPSPQELARYVFFEGKKVAQLTDAMMSQVNRHGLDKNIRMRITGPNPATQDQRDTARKNGMALPGSQFIELDIYKYEAPDKTTAYGLVAMNQRTVDHLLLWHPEFRITK